MARAFVCDGPRHVRFELELLGKVSAGLDPDLFDIQSGKSCRCGGTGILDYSSEGSVVRSSCAGETCRGTQPS
jgi:hypothetical protein